MKKDEIIKEINKRYRAKKMEKYPYMAPEQLPDELISDQANAMMEVFAELLEEITEKNIGVVYDDGTSMKYKKMMVDKATKLADELLKDKK